MGTLCNTHIQTHRDTTHTIPVHFTTLEHLEVSQGLLSKLRPCEGLSLSQFLIYEALPPQVGANRLSIHCASALFKLETPSCISPAQISVKGIKCGCSTFWAVIFQNAPSTKQANKRYYLAEEKRKQRSRDGAQCTRQTSTTTNSSKKIWANHQWE